jgi:hypothetical protein
MTFLDQLPDNFEPGTLSDRRTLCCYTNQTPHVQVARISNISNWYFERVVFPGERLLFEALAVAVLEIYTTDSVTTILADRISCDRLQAAVVKEFCGMFKPV